MGKIFISLDDIITSLNDGNIQNYEVEQFLKKFFQIGFECTAKDIFDQNTNYYFDINFEYDQFKNINIDKIFRHYESFLKTHEIHDNILFFIAENYYEEFKKFQREYFGYFNIVKKTFVKKPNYSRLLRLVRHQISIFYSFRDKFEKHKNDMQYEMRGLSEFFVRNHLNNKSEYNSSIYNQIKNIEDQMKNFISENDEKLQTNFDLIIEKYYDLENDLLAYSKPNGNRTIRRSSRDTMSEMNMSYSLEPKYNEESIDFKKTLEEIKKEKNNIDSFEKLSNKIHETFFFRINEDLLINFISSKRIEEYAKDLNDLKNNFGSILKD